MTKSIDNEELTTSVESSASSLDEDDLDLRFLNGSSNHVDLPPEQKLRPPSRALSVNASMHGSNKRHPTHHAHDVTQSPSTSPPLPMPEFSRRCVSEGQLIPRAGEDLDNSFVLDKTPRTPRRLRSVSSGAKCVLTSVQQDMEGLLHASATTEITQALTEFHASWQSEKSEVDAGAGGLVDAQKPNRGFSYPKPLMDNARDYQMTRKSPNISAPGKGPLFPTSRATGSRITPTSAGKHLSGSGGIHLSSTPRPGGNPSGYYNGYPSMSTGPSPPSVHTWSTSDHRRHHQLQQQHHPAHNPIGTPYPPHHHSRTRYTRPDASVYNTDYPYRSRQRDNNLYPHREEVYPHVSYSSRRQQHVSHPHRNYYHQDTYAEYLMDRAAAGSYSEPYYPPAPAMTMASHGCPPRPPPQPPMDADFRHPDANSATTRPGAYACHVRWSYDDYEYAVPPTGRPGAFAVSGPIPEHPEDYYNSLSTRGHRSGGTHTSPSQGYYDQLRVEKNKKQVRHQVQSPYFDKKSMEHPTTPPRRDHFPVTKNNITPQQKQRATPAATDTVYLDVGNGKLEPLRRAQETQHAISNDFFVPATCLVCAQADLFVIADCQYFVCPTCELISRCCNSSSSDRHHDASTLNVKKFGVGLGFTSATLMKAQSEIFQDCKRKVLIR